MCREFLPLLLAVTLLTSGAVAQGTSGTITGVVNDSTGAAVVGATITVRNLDTGVVRTAVSGSDGRYSVPGLSVGRYEVSAEHGGFAKYVRGPINLVVAQTAIINPELKPVTVQELVTVTEDAPVLDTSSAEVGVRFDSQRLTAVPTGTTTSGGSFREVWTFALSAPGVSTLNSGNSSFAAGADYSANGNRVRSNNFMIDGADSNEVGVTGRNQTLNNPEIVQEFRLVTSQFQAEHGRASGSVVNVITKSGSNDLHGSLYWFNNSTPLNARSNLDKANASLNGKTPFRAENQYGGTIGGPIVKGKTFYYGSLQRWTDRQLGSGFTVTGAPTEAGRQVLQTTAGTLPQVQALLQFLPAGAANGRTQYFCSGTTTAPTPADPNAPLAAPPTCSAGTLVAVPLGDVTNSTRASQDNWQWSARVDHNWDKHSLGGRFLYNDDVFGGNGQATPPGLTSEVKQRALSASTWWTSNWTAAVLNETRVSYQRSTNDNSPTDPASLTIPSIEITPLGLSGFNASPTRTGLGFGANLPQFRFNNGYQIQNTTTWTKGSHTMKVGLDLRRTDVKSFFFPISRGRLEYTGTFLQDFINDVAATVNINRPLPGGQLVNYYEWDDYYFFAQDSWSVTPSFTLNYGLRYELPGNTVQKLIELNESIQASNGGQAVFALTPVPERDNNNFQPRLGFAWNPRTNGEGLWGALTGGDKLVVRGGYSLAHDYQFLNIALNIASSFPFVAAINRPNLAGSFANIGSLQLGPAELGDPAALNLLTRTVVHDSFRAPYSQQFSLEVQRAITPDTVFRLGYVGTKGTALFQTVDGNPTTLCRPIPATGCPRQDPTRGVIRLRGNFASSIYHSMQASFDKRYSNGLSFGTHYTWSTFIDTASEIFNPSGASEIALPQNPYNTHAGERGRSAYDRPHRLAANVTYELPFFRSQEGAAGRIAGGWQISSVMSFQSGSPFSVLNGTDPGLTLLGISGLVGTSTRPNLNTNLDLSSMSLAEILAAGGASLFSPIPTRDQLNANLALTPFGNVGRNTLRGDGINQVDLSIAKNTKIAEGHTLTFRADMFNLTNTRDFGVPISRINSTSFLNEKATDGGNRRIYLSLRYAF